MAWLTGWTYRKSITLSRASGAVTNYQMKLLIGESSGASGEDVDCGGHCLSSFNDLRFTASDGSTLLDYWIESISGATPNQLATVWIEFDSIGTDATTFYMYYGKADAAAASNGANTFLFFDHFDGDLSKWSGDTDGATIASSILTLTGGDDYEIHSTAFAGDIALRSKTKITDADYNQIGLSDDPINDDYVLLFHASSRANHSAHVTNNSGSFTDFSNAALLFDDYAIYDITRSLTGTDTIRSFTDGVQNGTGNTANVPTANLTAMFRVVGAGVKIYSDWILIRQYNETEPAWGSWGSEEDINVNVTIAPAPLEVTAGLSCGEIVEWPVLLTIDPLEVTAGLSAGLAHELPAPALGVAAGLDVTAISYGFFIVPDPLEVTAGLSASLAHSIPAPALGVAAGLTAKTLIGLPAVLGVTAGLAATGIIVIQSDEYIITYLCKLTPQPGSAYSEITIPMSSFQGRFKSGDPSYLSCVIPGSDYATAISDRNDPVNPPELSVYMRKTFSDGNVITEQIMAVDLEDTTIDEGSTSYSITLSGHRTTTYSAKAITLTGASYKNLTGGKTRYRCAPDLYLRPGDTVTVNGDTFTADNISIAISVDSQTMEVSEE